MRDNPFVQNQRFAIASRIRFAVLTLLKEAGKSDSSDADEGVRPTVPTDVRVFDVEEAYTRFRTEEKESHKQGSSWQSPDALLIAA